MKSLVDFFSDVWYNCRGLKLNVASKGKRGERCRVFFVRSVFVRKNLARVIIEKESICQKNKRVKLK